MADRRAHLRRLLPAALAGLAAVGPTSRPTSAPVPPVATWFAQLADADAAVRDNARDQLMGLSAGDLPRLLGAVRAARPVRPAQAAALHEVVCHVFLTAEPYTTEDGPPRYIMGQSWPRTLREVDRLGVPVVHRWPGFPARRLLRDGDLILGLYADPDAPADRPPDVPTRTVDALVTAMRECPSLPRLGLSVLRDGRPVRVTATLVPEPAQTVGRFPGPTAAFLLDRQRRADDYWTEQFAPVVCPP